MGFLLDLWPDPRGRLPIAWQHLLSQGQAGRKDSPHRMQSMRSNYKGDARVEHKPPRKRQKGNFPNARHRRQAGIAVYFLGRHIGELELRWESTEDPFPKQIFRRWIAGKHNHSSVK